MMKKCVHLQRLSGAACIGDWGRANLCKGLKVPLLHTLMQILFPHNIEIHFFRQKKRKKKKKGSKIKEKFGTNWFITVKCLIDVTNEANIMWVLAQWPDELQCVSCLPNIPSGLNDGYPIKICFQWLHSYLAVLLHLKVVLIIICNMSKFGHSIKKKRI